MVYNERFPVLTVVAKILFIFGIIILILGLIFGSLELIEFLRLVGKTGAKWRWAANDYAFLGLFVFCTLSGLITMAIAEIIGVLFSIEKNTRE